MSSGALVAGVAALGWLSLGGCIFYLCWLNVILLLFEVLDGGWALGEVGYKWNSLLIVIYNKNLALGWG